MFLRTKMKGKEKKNCGLKKDDAFLPEGKRWQLKATLIEQSFIYL